MIKEKIKDKIKVLFVPFPMPSHAIPLIYLARQLNVEDFEYTFLLPANFHEQAKLLNINFLDIDRKLEDKINPEMIAFSAFKPDLIVDDLSFTSAFSTRLLKIPRISIVRKGIFPHEKYTHGTRHSSNAIEWLSRLENLSLGSYGIWEPKDIPDLFVGDVNIIPSVPSVEELPPEVKGSSTYHYAGPLILEDFVDPDEIKNVEVFIETNKNRKIAYFTLGLAEETMDHEVSRRLKHCFQTMIDNGIAIITNIKQVGEYLETNTEESKYIYYRDFLPMHAICEKAELMVHHCGSGAYNYQLLYQLPAIILGNLCYDRDEVGVRLAELGAAEFISADLDEETFFQEFDSAISSLIDSASETTRKQKASLSKLQSELKATADEFDFQKIVRDLVKNARP